MATQNNAPHDPPGAWIFVSHSNRDMAGVRAVRDELERLGHYPLLFFLKCVNEHDELEGLITREIEARNFFLLCDSANARTSGWVQREVAHIQSLPNRVWRTVDLEADAVAQLRAIRELAENATVFLSYARQDWEAVAPLQEALLSAEYRVWGDASLPPGARWQEQIEGGIAQAMHDGFVIVFLTPEAVASDWVRYEVEAALHLAAVDPKGMSRIVPVVLRGGPSLVSALPAEVQSIVFLDLSGLSPGEAGQRLIRRLRQG
jgi:hypothetical protein